MSDLLNDLKWVCDNLNEGSEGEAAVKAAIDEITSLRQEIKRLRGENEQLSRISLERVADATIHLRDALMDSKEQLAACRALLREAVETIDGHMVDRTWTADWVKRAARAAGGDGDGK